VAGGIISKIWGENDSAAALYIVFANVPGLPGLLLLLSAATGWPKRWSVRHARMH